MHITSCVFLQNSASGNGGAIYATGSSDIIISDGTFITNDAGGSGGAIYDDSTFQLLISGSAFGDDTASSGSGGAIYSATTTSIDTSTFMQNMASDGGAINN